MVIKVAQLVTCFFVVFHLFRTALHLACVQGHTQIVQTLLEWKAKCNTGDNQAKTPLIKVLTIIFLRKSAFESEKSVPLNLTTVYWYSHQYMCINVQ